MNNFFKGLILIASAISLLALAGCGGGASGSGTVAGASTGLGIFLDAPVQGVTYTSGNTSGTTGADGSFTYEIGQAVTFTLGGVVIGTATPTSTTTAILTPVDLVAGAVGTTNTTAQQIAVFLQTLDSDSNPANGIQINAATVLAAAGQVVDFTNPATVTAVLTAISPTAIVVTAAQAKTNMDNARLAATAGHYTGSWSGTCTTGAISGTWVSDISTTGVVSGTSSEATAPAGTPAAIISGTITAMGSVSASASGSSANATWTGTSTLDGHFSGSWTQAAITTPAQTIPACSGTFTGTKSINNVLSFAGTYQGTFSGTDSGTWSATVGTNGTITGAGNSALVGAFTVAGTTNANGSATMTQSQGGVSTGAVFRGTANPYGSISGSWVNASASGSFSGFRN